MKKQEDGKFYDLRDALNKEGEEVEIWVEIDAMDYYTEADDE